MPSLIPFLEQKNIRKRINILGSEKIAIPVLVHKMEELLHKKGKYIWLDEGACYDIPENEGECILIKEADYADKILRKYIQL